MGLPHQSIDGADDSVNLDVGSRAATQSRNAASETWLLFALPKHVGFIFLFFFSSVHLVLSLCLRSAWEHSQL